LRGKYRGKFYINITYIQSPKQGFRPLAG